MSVGLWLLAVVMSTLVQNEDGSWRPPFADPGIGGPGEPCPWPFDPAMLHGAPLGQYHCPSCGSMVLAGVAHIDYTFTDEDMAYLEQLDTEWKAVGGPPPADDDW